MSTIFSLYCIMVVVMFFLSEIQVDDGNGGTRKANFKERTFFCILWPIVIVMLTIGCFRGNIDVDRD